MINRSLVSFQGKCPLNCKHCYTGDLAREPTTDVDEVVDSIKNENPDIIYVSHDYENFYDDGKGMKLCEKLYDAYGTHILIITRRVLSEKIVNELYDLSERMERDGKKLIFCESIFSTKSYSVSESCESPDERISCLNHVHEMGISTILMLRPVFPEKYVPLMEYDELISKVKVKAVVTSGLVITDKIKRSLGWENEKINYGPNLGSEYLSSLNPDDVHYVDVSRELEYIKERCIEREIPCYNHSMEAVRLILRG